MSQGALCRGLGALAGQRGLTASAWDLSAFLAELRAGAGTGHGSHLPGVCARTPKLWTMWISTQMSRALFATGKGQSGEVAGPGGQEASSPILNIRGCRGPLLLPREIKQRAGGRELPFPERVYPTLPLCPGDGRRKRPPACGALSPDCLLCWPWPSHGTSAPQSPSSVRGKMDGTHLLRVVGQKDKAAPDLLLSPGHLPRGSRSRHHCHPHS